MTCEGAGHAHLAMDPEPGHDLICFPPDPHFPSFPNRGSKDFGNWSEISDTVLSNKEKHDTAAREAAARHQGS